MLAVVVGLLCAQGSALAAAAPPPLALQEQVVDSFVNGVGDPVLLRRGYYLGGGTGFGYEKITKKHGITNMASSAQ